MDSSSSPSKYDVFLSFRSEDTRKTFVSHLYRALDQKGIRTYKDENQQTREGIISPAVALAIKESNIAVVVLSEKYASSAWCLSVLAKIIESSMVTKAVFYEVDPGAWRRRSDEFWTHQERERPGTVGRWIDALERLESTGRRFCSRSWEDDSKMLDELIISISSARNTSAPVILRSQRRLPWLAVPHIRMSSFAALSSRLTTGSTRDIHRKHIPKSLSGSGETELERGPHQDTSAEINTSNELPSPPSDDPNLLLVGLDRHKKAVYGLLDLESKSQVRVVGIWGIEGAGKTTLAECVFEDVSRHFQHQCFLTNVDDIHQNRISPSLLEHLKRTRRSSDDSFDAIKPSLVNRNVLLVLDGVHDNDQLKDIVKVSRWLGPGSRVIMTSKDKNSLLSCGVKYVYEMECLRYEEALQLFSQFAFKKTHPLIGFERLSIRLVHFAGRLPLSLKVLGSFLYGKDEESWKCTLRRLDASQDNCTREVSSYIGACDYLPRHQIELERYVGADEGEYSPSYHMLL